jgi:cobalt-zinc-cadmium efflux system membrane fusion protein
MKSNTLKKRIFIIAISVFLIIAAVYIIKQLKTISPAPLPVPAETAGLDEHGHEAGEHEGDEDITIAGLKTAPVLKTSVTAMLTVTGEVHSNEDQTAKIGSPVSGRLTSLSGKVGMRVHAGQTIAIVSSRDIADMQSALIRAKSEEQAARKRLIMVKELAATGALTQRPLDDAENALTLASAEVKQAESSLARARNARDLANTELERKRQLAKANAYHGPQIETARGNVAKAQAEHESAISNVKVKQSAFDRSKRLFDAGIAARREMEACEAELENAKTKEKESRIHIEIARQTLAREENIAGQGLYTSSELKSAESVLHQAEREVDSSEAMLSRAKSQLEVAQSILSREKKVAGKSLFAKQEIQKEEAAVIRANAEVKSAENALRALRIAEASGNAASITISAPISGIITERMASPGQAVSAAEDLFTIVNTDHVWVWANVYEKDLSKIRLGQSAEIIVASFPDRIFKGTVRQIGDNMNAGTRTARIRCDVANPGSVLKSGMFANVNLSTGKNQQVILIPKKAVMDEAGKKIVFSPCTECEEDKIPGKSGCGSFDKIEVTLGTAYKDQIEVISGLKESMDVVTVGQFQLKTALGSGQLKDGCADGH